jgi:hypothetical protein
MPRRALIEQRPWLLGSLAAGISYYFIADSQLPGLYQLAWKGAGVALLAVYALVRGRSADARQIAAVMAFGALGDVLIELAMEWGAAAFLAGHLVAIQLARIAGADPVDCVGADGKSACRGLRAWAGRDGGECLAQQLPALPCGARRRHVRCIRSVYFCANRCACTEFLARLADLAAVLLRAVPGLHRSSG